MPYDITQSPDHADRGVAKFLEQFKNDPGLDAVTRSYLNRVQELENAIWEVILIRGIDLSEGVGLDVIGRVVGRARLGLIDSDYRIALRAQIRINRSSGTPEDLIAVAVLSMPAGFTFSYDEFPTATIVVHVNEQVGFNIQVLFDNLNRTRAGGVRLLLEYPSIDADTAFAFSNVSATSDPLKGFGDAVTPLPSVGGYLISVISS
jgi:hypothetical protein